MNLIAVIKFCKRNIFLFLGSFLLIFPEIHECYGQSLQFIRYGEDEGLSNSLVKSVTADKNGFIWVGTDGGLFRFDGRYFTQIQNDLPSQFIKSVYCRSNGDIISSTDLGVVQILNNPPFLTVNLLKRGSIKKADSLVWFPKTIYEDKDKYLWFCDNQNIYCLKDKVIKSFFPGSKASSNNYQRTFSFSEDGFGNLYIFSEPGFIYRFDKNKNALIEINLPLKLSSIQSVVNIDVGKIFIGTHTGLFEFQTDKEGSCTKLIALDTQIEASTLIRVKQNLFLAGTWTNGLYQISFTESGYSVKPMTEFPEKTINHFCLQSDGNLWVATDNGLYLMRPYFFSSPYINSTSKYIQSIAEYPDGRICFTDGEKVFSTKKDISESPLTIKSSRELILQAIPLQNGTWYADVSGFVWFENTAGLIEKRFDFRSSGHAVFYLTFDHKGRLWACQDLNQSLICISPDFSVKTYGVNEGIASRPLTVGLDHAGNIYAGGMSDEAYLFAYNPTTDRFTNLSKPLTFEHNIDININDIAFSKKGIIWLGSSFGLIKYENGIFNRMQISSLTDASVKAVTLDRDDNVWFGTSLGLHQFVRGELLSFDERTGMPSKSINYRSIHVDRYNRIWAGTVNGITVSLPILPAVRTVKPVIVDMLINNNPFNYKTDGITLNQRAFLKIKLGVPDYPAKFVKIEMLLLGRDTSWIPVDKTQEIDLVNLASGKYTLYIRAKKYGNYLYSSPLKWEFHVSKSWYFLWWVILLEGIFLLLFYWVGLKLYTRNLLRNNDKLEQAINERTREILIQKEQIEGQSQSIIMKNAVLAQTNIELEQAKINAEKALKTKSEFLSVMSHELRTPLNAVIGTSHLLFKNNPRPDQSEDLRILRFSAENLLSLINNILDFNKIEVGKVSLEYIDFNLRTIVEEIVSSMTSKAQEKNIELNFDFDDSIPVNVIGDPLRLSQIINNLLSNALKFTETGKVTIALKLNSNKLKQIIVDFSVTDSGIGMQPETLQSIFDAFTQASSETSRKYGGTGLGLTITGKLLELFGSKIYVESEFGKGSRFYFSILFNEGSVTNATIEPKNTSNVFKQFTGQRILLVEDNKVNKLIASKFLSDWNLKVDTAENGLIAVDKITKHSFDLILMDLQMPEMDGYQATSEIRKLKIAPYTTIPIIALTASSKADVFEKIFLSGMNDYISKPFNPEDLYDKISKYLK